MFKVFIIQLIAVVAILQLVTAYVPKVSKLLVRKSSLFDMNNNNRKISNLVDTLSNISSNTPTSRDSHINGNFKTLGLNFPPVTSFGKNHKSEKNYGKHILGGKGANLASMSNIGLAVPPGFTITTEVCALYNNMEPSDRKLPDEVWKEVMSAVSVLEKDNNRKFGDSTNPLLVSVRSGAAISMPGMMDTVLNLGLNDKTVEGLANTFGERFALDSYRRFLNMFGDVVLNIPHHEFEKEMTKLKQEVKVTEDSALEPIHLRKLVEKYKEVYVKHGFIFPEDPIEQLRSSILAVFNSWNSDRAIKYRQVEGIAPSSLLGTAVNVQTMVFGNMNDQSGTGVLFTRNPNTGEHTLFGEYLVNAQGEDVVAGIRTPTPINKLKELKPKVYAELLRNVELLEKNYHDMQDVEFTVQDNQLYILQTRNGKRGGAAAIKIAVDMVKQNLASIDEGIMSVKPEHLKQLLHPQFANDVKSKKYSDNVITKGLASSPGAAVGRIAFTSSDAEKMSASGEKVILVRSETSPEDVNGMFVSAGILTATGGYTSHASVVARGWGKPCVCGTSSLNIDEEAKTVTITTLQGQTLKFVEGDYISINGETGDVLKGKQDLKAASFETNEDLTTFMGWVDQRKIMKVATNADTPKDARDARKNGAQGIGLCRTEHMFFADDRINVVRRMILSKETNDLKARQDALNQLIEFQRKDFEGILEAMDGYPCTIRLLDPPLHEFMPKLNHDSSTNKDFDAVFNDAFLKEVNLSKDEVIFITQKLQESNPMLGLRGCRLGIVMPELVEMQTRAIIEAALINKYEKFLDPRVEIMIPLVGSVTEYTHQANIIRSTAKKIFDETGKIIDFKIGTMLEIPRACLTAKEFIKAGAEFFSYGTNDLTQMTYGFSRDDVGSYMPEYIKSGILEKDPFTTIDEKGVGALIKMSADAGKAYSSKKRIPFKCGVCGEHGGDPASVKIFSKMGLDYVSCSPFSVPIARLAAAQAVIENNQK